MFLILKKLYYISIVYYNSLFMLIIKIMKCIESNIYFKNNDHNNK